jgi:hypothetical protein
MFDSSNFHSSPEAESKPGYISSFSNAARQFKNYGWNMLAVTVALGIMMFILYIPIFSSLNSFNYFSYHDYYMRPMANMVWIMLYFIVFYLILGLLFYGYILASIKAARGERPVIFDLFRPFQRFFHVVFSGILLYLIVFVGFILFFIPGIFLLCRLIFTPNLIVDEKKGVFRAFADSWEMTHGHFWKIFLLGLTMVGFELVISLIVLIITFAISPNFFSGFIYGDISGIWGVSLASAIIFIPFYMYISLIWGSLYNAINLERERKNQPPQDINPDTASGF